MPVNFKWILGLVGGGALGVAYLALSVGPNRTGTLATGGGSTVSVSSPALLSDPRAAETLATANRVGVPTRFRVRADKSSSFKARCRAFMDTAEPGERRERLDRLVGDEAVADLRRILEDEAALGWLPEEVFHAMLRRLAREDAAWTGDYLAVLPAGLFRAELTGTVMTAWGQADLPAALEWAKSCADAGLRREALLHLGHRWFASHPEEALAFAAQDPGTHRQLLVNLVGLWTREQPEVAAAWAVEFLSAPETAGVATNAIATWAGRDALAAAEFVLGLPQGPVRHEAAVSVMAALARRDPDTGAVWVDAFRDGTERTYAIENLAYGWAPNDPEAAWAWAERLPPGERDQAIFAGAGGLIDARPELAAGWVLAIQDEHLRLRQSERVARQWLLIDRGTAEAWIRRSGLPEPTQRRLLSHSPPGA